jgi:hypothetical protein
MMGRVAGAALLVVCSAMGALGDPGPVKVLSTNRDIFYFKIDKEFLGALLEVFDRDGNKVIEQRLEKRKVLLDFYYDQPGRYSIRISYGPMEKIYIYEKYGPSHAERFSGDFVLVSEY